MVSSSNSTISNARGKQKAPEPNNTIGTTFTSPRKKRASAKSKTKNVWPIMNGPMQLKKLQNQLKDIMKNAEDSERKKTHRERELSEELKNIEVARNIPGEYSNNSTNIFNGGSNILDKGMGENEMVASYESVEDNDWEDIETPEPTQVPGPSISSNLSSKRPINQIPYHAEANSKTTETIPPAKKKRLTPDSATHRLYNRWQSLLPTLIDDYLFYTTHSTGKVVSVVENDLVEGCQRTATNGSPNKCSGKSTNKTSSIIQCLYYDHFKQVKITFCNCRSLQQVLVRNGLFPTSPSQTRMAVSIDLLNFYSALFERSCDANLALAKALNSFYTGRGYYILDKKTGNKCDEPFRKGLGYALQWLDVLQLQIEERVEEAIVSADALACAKENGVGWGTETPTKQATVPDGIKPEHPLQFDNVAPSSTECHRRLQQMCPSCFGLKEFGRDLENRGGDIHVATDGNFHQRHATKAGAGIPFHHPKHIIPAEFVNKVGAHIESVRKKPPSQPKKTTKVPAAALDECEKSYEAANGDKKRADEVNPRYDDYGLMSLVCRHGIGLFFANIDTAGEQQKYAVSLLLWMFQYLPLEATVILFYDIGCVLDRSLDVYDIIPSSILSRLRFATTAMHAYGHQWSCQLQYNPRMCCGCGLTDGECVECVWSLIRKLIPIVRVSSRARRLWITDRFIASIGYEAQKNLGAWGRKKLKDGVEAQQQLAKDTIKKSGHSFQHLRDQWELQKAAQSTADCRTPAKLKKEIQIILDLQDEIKTLETTIALTKKGISTSKRPKTQKAIDSLDTQHSMLVDEVEELYQSLNLHRSYPELQGLTSEFVRTLLLADELKVSIRRGAIESFYELGRLDQAAGGRHQALGTKLHQQTRDSISKRMPALMKKVNQFNNYVDDLSKLQKGSQNKQFPLPKKLSTEIAKLRDESVLMEDVWMKPLIGDKPPEWMVDPTVRKGIQAVLKYDRCTEERMRLGLEADNKCRWFGRELLAIELALRNPQNQALLVALINRRDHILHLKGQWVSVLASSIRYDNHVHQSVTLANRIAGQPLAIPEFYKPLVIAVVDNPELAEVEEVEPRPEAEDETESSQSPTVDDLEDLDFLEAQVYSSTKKENGISISAISSLVSESREPHLRPASHPETGPEIMEAPDWPLEEESRRLFIEVELVWFTPGQLLADGDLLKEVTSMSLLPSYLSLSNQPLDGKDLDVPLYGRRRRNRNVFLEEDLSILTSQRDLLNDVCINGCAELLQVAFGERQPSAAGKCALFNTFDLPKYRDVVKSESQGLSSIQADQLLWKFTSRRTSYWEKDVWILPIHRPGASGKSGHWVMCTVYPREGVILLLDSFAGRQPWEDQLEEISSYLSRLVSAAHAFSKKPLSKHFQEPFKWKAYPVSTNSVQFNDRDCGLWVLAWIAAVLRGNHTLGSNFTEKVMPSWRYMLLQLVLEYTQMF